MNIVQPRKSNNSQLLPCRCALLFCLLVPALALSAGCAGEDGGSGGDAPGGGGSAGADVVGSEGTGGTGDHGGEATGGGSGADTGGTAGTGGGATDGPPALVSNTPAAQFNQTAEGDAAALVLVGSNVGDRPSGSEYYQQWFGEVFNQGSTTLCHVQVDASFLSGGSPVVSHYGFADAAPHDTSSMVVACIPPGASGMVYSNGFGASPISPGSITQVNVIIKGNVYPDTVPSSTEPRLENGHVVEPYGAGMGYWALSGTARGAGGTIYNIGLNVYPKDSTGLAFDRLIETNLDSLPVGGAWDFETTSAEQPFTEYRSFFEYLQGSASYSLGVSHEPSRQKMVAQQRDAWRARMDSNRTTHQLRVAK